MAKQQGVKKAPGRKSATKKSASSARKLAPKRTAAKKPAVKKAAPAKKVAAKKSVMKKAASKKAAVKRSVMKGSASKKVSVQKPTVKKGAAKKPAMKKAASKQVAGKKSAVKRLSARKAAPKKATPKRTTMKPGLAPSREMAEAFDRAVTPTAWPDAVDAGQDVHVQLGIDQRGPDRRAQLHAVHGSPNELHPGTTRKNGNSHDRPGSELERKRHQYPSSNIPNRGSAHTTQAKGKRRNEQQPGE